MGIVCKDDGWRMPDALWAEIKPLLPPPKPHPYGGHNPRVDDRTAMDAILFVLRTGCQWHALDATKICSHSSAYRRFREWVDAGVFRELWKRGLLKFDAGVGIDWAWQSMDGAMSKAPLGGEATGPNPTDRAKTGTKRSVLSEGHGIPIAVSAAGANRNDFKMARETLEALPIQRPEPSEDRPQGLCLDKGYDYDEIRDLAREFGYTPHIVPRAQEAKAIKREIGFKARRWVVERTHSWLNRFRRILVRWEKRLDTYLAMLHFACAIVTWRAAGLFSG